MRGNRDKGALTSIQTRERLLGVACSLMFYSWVVVSASLRCFVSLL